MALFAKDSLHPGSVSASTEDGERVLIDFTPDDVEHYRQRMQDMLAAGLQIPLSLEHQGRAKPMTPAELDQLKAEKVRLVMGHATSVAMSTDGALMPIVDVADPDDIKVLKKNKYVSPGLALNFQDGSGRIWPGYSITHLAVTPRPVQHRQKPYRQIGLSLGSEPQAKHLWLSLGDDDMPFPPKKKDEQQPEDATPPPDEANGAPEEEVPEPPPVQGVQPDLPAQPDPAMMGLLKTLADPAIGLPLPEDTTLDNIVDRLHSAALTKIAHIQQADQESQEAEAQQGQNAVPKPACAPQDTMEEAPRMGPIMMSLQAEVATLKAQGQSWQARTSALEKRIIDDARAKHEADLDAIGKSGFLPAKSLDRMRGQLKTANLSLGADGVLEAHPLLETIVALKESAEESRLKQDADRKAAQEAKAKEAAGKRAVNQFFPPHPAVQLSVPGAGEVEGVTREQQYEEETRAGQKDKDLINKLSRGAYEQYAKQTEGK